MSAVCPYDPDGSGTQVTGILSLETMGVDTPLGFYAVLSCAKSSSIVNIAEKQVT